jgi:NitT/TauT family transport system substrate-binding protein
VLIFEPHAFTLSGTLGANAIIWSAQGHEIARAVAYTTDAYAGTHPQVVEKYLATLADAEVFVRQHPDEARSLIARVMKYDPAYMAYVWPKFFYGLSLNQDLLETLEAEARWAIDQHLTEAKEVPNYLERIDFNGLELVRPDVVTIVH